MHDVTVLDILDNIYIFVNFDLKVRKVNMRV